MHDGDVLPVTGGYSLSAESAKAKLNKLILLRLAEPTVLILGGFILGVLTTLFFQKSF
jgi:hypothetical protein